MRWLLLLVPLFFSEAFGFDNPYVMRSPRGLLMGDAFTAVNDDAYTLFYNPASMARHKRDLSFYPLNGHLSATNVLEDLDRFEDFPDDAVGVSEVLMDYPAHASAGVAPGFKLFNFGMNLIAADSVDVLLRNRSHPMLDLDVRKDRGFIMGLGIPLGSGRISKKSKSGSQTSFGIGAKYIQRTGINDRLSLTGPTVLDSLGQEEIEEVMRSWGR